MPDPSPEELDLPAEGELDMLDDLIKATGSGKSDMGWNLLQLALRQAAEQKEDELLGEIMRSLSSRLVPAPPPPQSLPQPSLLLFVT